MWDQYPDLEDQSRNPDILCFQSSVTLMHDTGDLYGKIVMVRLIRGDRKLAETMARLSGAEVTYFDKVGRPFLSSLQSAHISFPQKNHLRMDGKEYLATSSELVNDKAEPIGYLAVALAKEPFLHQRNQVIFNSLLPLILTGIISLFIFLLLKGRVFGKITLLSDALRKVAQSGADFSLRLPAPDAESEKMCDEVERMVIDFNHMMVKLQDTYGQVQCARQEIEKVNHELEERVKHRTAQLSVMYESLKEEIEERQQAEKERLQLARQLQRAQKMEAIGTLAGGVAHDLNNILSGVVSYPELLLLTLPEDSPMRAPLQTIQRSGLKAAAVVKDLLALARRGINETKVVNLNDIVAEYLDSPEFRTLQAQRPEVRVETLLEKNLFNIVGSSVHLAKTIMNLVINAFEAIDGEGRVLIRTENSYVDRPFRGYDHVEEGDYVRLTVADTGAGIDDADLERIFEPFFSRKKMGRSGSGLGMTVVWASVKDHHGYIDISSRKGAGTAVYLYFPITDRTPSPENDSVCIDALRGHGEHLLVVDDVAEQLEIAGQMLRYLGYRVSTVASGEAAEAFVRDAPVDLLVLDMIMEPGIDGQETLRRILAKRPGQKAIIASGYAESEKVKETLLLGAAAFVKKPYSLEKIGRAVHAALSAG